MEALKKLLQPMETAPKDGTHIIIVWEEPHNDVRIFDIREAWWWMPTSPLQTAKPHWEYISDKHYCMSISRPIGWMPIK